MPFETPTIRRLPESVVTHLRSTLAVTTLSDAISELVQNSLDANARSIKIQVNLPRNSCVIEDDGVGIAPVDVSMVGKMYGLSPPQN
jgi:DNA mismatch repair protein MLH3